MTLDLLIIFITWSVKPWGSAQGYKRPPQGVNEVIVVGDLSAKKLVKTKMAKSVLDTGFSAFKTMLKYKCENASVLFEEVNESFTTQMCSCCGEITASSPKGRADLRIRVWECENCLNTNDRDLNSSKNILALGLKRLAVGITSV